MKMKKKRTPLKAFSAFLKKRYSLSMQQQLVLLLKREDTRIQSLRSEWKIPLEGFLNEKQRRIWWDKLGELVPEKVRDVEYLEFENIYNLREFYPESVTLSVDLEEYPRVTLIKKNPQAVFDLEVKKLLLDIRLDQDLHATVRDYIWYGGAHQESVVNTGIVVSERITVLPEVGELERKIAINIGVNHDEQDLRDIYSFFVKGLQQMMNGYLKGKKKPQKEFERNLKILTLYNQGKTVKGIAGDLAKEDISMDDGYIRKILSRIKAY